MNGPNVLRSSQAEILTRLRYLPSIPSCPMYTRVDNRVPAMCLVCGQMLCCDAFCCKETVHGRNVGSCTAHAYKCGAGTGIFLRVRDCVVLLINGIGKGCFYPSPYLDAYGETDRELRYF